MEPRAAPPTAARGRTWAFRLLTATLTPTLLILLAECGARLLAKGTGNERAMAYDAELGWRPLPNMTKSGEYWGVTRPARTNSRGWRDDERSFERVPGKRRALLIGDSFAFGLHVDDEDRISECLERDIGGLEVGVFKTAIPSLSNDIELFPGMSKKWGLSFLINTQQAPTGRSAGSLGWAGLANTYFWVDRTRRVAGVFLSQVLPFYDTTAVDLLVKFETEVYQALS